MTNPAKNAQEKNLKEECLQRCLRNAQETQSEDTKKQYLEEAQRLYKELGY